MDVIHVLKHVFKSCHLDQFMELMEKILETDRISDLLDWEEIKVQLRMIDPDMDYSNHCLKKEYDRQFELYKLYLFLYSKYGYHYDSLTKCLTYSEEIYAEISYYQPKIHNIKHEILEPSIFRHWATVFAPRPKLSESANYDEDEIGRTCVMRWNPAVDKNISLGIEHSTFLDQTDDSLLHWVAALVVESDDDILRSWKEDVLINLRGIPETQPVPAHEDYGSR